MAVFVGYGSHILADMMTVGGVQFFWPSRVIAVFSGRDEYRVLSGSTSERVFIALALVFALLFTLDMAREAHRNAVTRCRSPPQRSCGTFPSML
jgi:membrane-bound metal-dependent hydrolase YbcI (DUF457 family)